MRWECHTPFCEIDGDASSIFQKESIVQYTIWWKSISYYNVSLYDIVQYSEMGMPHSPLWKTHTCEPFPSRSSSTFCWKASWTDSQPDRTNPDKGFSSWSVLILFSTSKALCRLRRQKKYMQPAGRSTDVTIESDIWVSVCIVKLLQQFKHEQSRSRTKNWSTGAKTRP